MIIRIEDQADGGSYTNYSEAELRMLWDFVNQDFDKLIRLLRFINSIETAEGGQ